MKFTFSAITELIKETGVTLETIGDLAKDLSNVPTIAYIGNKYAGGDLTKEQIIKQLDAGTFQDALEIVNEFGKQVAAYFAPNEQSQAQ